MLLQMAGGAAFSQSARQKKLERIARENPGVSELGAEFVHLCDVSSELSPEAHSALQALLAYGPSRPPEAVSGVSLLVVPRIGTISPWSSKATDIARNC